MTTSGSTLPPRLTRVDKLILPDHTHLTSEDECYFFGEYPAHRDYSFGPINDLINNFKKSLDYKDNPWVWQHKQRVIAEVAEAFRSVLQHAALDVLTFVPIPPSKAKGDPGYDDRMTQMLLAMRSHPPVDVRDLIVQTESTDAVHEAEEGARRPRPEEIEAIYSIDEALTRAPINRIAVVDDLLTTGSHFKAAKSIIGKRFPGIQIVGLFIARRVPEPD